MLVKKYKKSETWICFVIISFVRNEIYMRINNDINCNNI